MGIALLVLFACGCVSGFALFRLRLLPIAENAGRPEGKLSVIVPARNEERNLAHLLDSLLAQTRRPDEIIVVDDFSADRTREIAERYGVTVMAGSELPPGWTGKNWAVWNGYLRSSGDLLLFLDADIRLAPNAVESLLAARERAGGVVSVVPFHHTERAYERLALTANLLGAFAFMSPFERGNPRQGLYGACILTTREDYEKVNGHDGVRAELLDDLNLGARYREAGIPVVNYLGYGLVSFRMYPNGIVSELQGFGKGAVLSTAKLMPGTVALVSVWLVGLLASCSVFFLAGSPWALPTGIGYLLYTLQIGYFLKYVGRFKWILPILHVVPSLFFLAILGYSLYRVTFVGHVAWKGRNISVGRHKNL